MISIKEHPELRHALAHLYYAIEALSKGHRGEALYELKSVEGLVFWEDDDVMTRHAETLMRGEINGDDEELQRQEAQELQGQKEVGGDSPAKDGGA